MLQKHFDSSPNSKTKNKLYDVNSNLEQQLKELSKLLKKLLCTSARKLQVPWSKNTHILSQETNKKNTNRSWFETLDKIDKRKF